MLFGWNPAYDSGAVKEHARMKLFAYTQRRIEDRNFVWVYRLCGENFHVTPSPLLLERVKNWTRPCMREAFPPQPGGGLGVLPAGAKWPPRNAEGDAVTSLVLEFDLRFPSRSAPAGPALHKALTILLANEPVPYQALEACSPFGPFIRVIWPRSDEWNTSSASALPPVGTATG